MALERHWSTGTAIWLLPTVFAVDRVYNRITVPSGQGVGILLQPGREIALFLAMFPYADDPFVLFGCIFNLPVDLYTPIIRSLKVSTGRYIIPPFLFVGVYTAIYTLLSQSDLPIPSATT